MSEVKKYLVWSGFGGLALGISILNGIDITSEGILSEIAKGILPFVAALIFNLFLFLVGTYSSYKELESFSEEDPEIIVLGASCFLMMLSFYIGTGLKIEWIQDIGVFSFLVLVGDLIYIKKTS